MRGYECLTATQLLSVVRAMGWRCVPGRGANIHLEPDRDDARAALPKGLAVAVNEQRIQLRTILAMEDHQRRNRSLREQMGD